MKSIYIKTKSTVGGKIPEMIITKSTKKKERRRKEDTTMNMKILDMTMLKLMNQIALSLKAILMNRLKRIMWVIKMRQI